MSTREPQELMLEDIRAQSTPLKHADSEDLLPEIAQLVSLVFEHGSSAIAQLTAQPGFDLKKTDVVAFAAVLAPVLSSVAEKLGSGTLKRLAPLLLKTTTVEMPDPIDGKRSRYEMMKSTDRAAVFDERPEIYFPLVFFAAKVTFLRYFPAAVRALMSSTPTASSE